MALSSYSVRVLYACAGFRAGGESAEEHAKLHECPTGECQWGYVDVVAQAGDVHAAREILDQIAAEDRGEVRGTVREEPYEA